MEWSRYDASTLGGNSSQVFDPFQLYDDAEVLVPVVVEPLAAGRRHEGRGVRRAAGLRLNAGTDGAQGRIPAVELAQLDGATLVEQQRYGGRCQPVVAGDAFLETAEDIARFARTFETISKWALSQAQSKKMIQDAARTA